jgi:autophagy-related protein 2
MIRVHVRCPPPPGKQPRSGAVIVDLHGLAFRTHPPDSAPTHEGASEPDANTRFDHNTSREQEEYDVFSSVNISKVYILNCPVGDRKATAVGYMTKTSHTSTMPADGTNTRDLMIKLHTIKASGVIRTRTVITVDAPAIFASLSKSHIDSLQFFADDLTQLFARLNLPSGSQTPVSYEGSIIGSRFFAKYGSRSGSITQSERQAAKIDSETVVKIRLMQGICASIFMLGIN